MIKDNTLDRLLTRGHKLLGQLSIVESSILSHCQFMCDVPLIDCTWQPSDGFVLCYEDSKGFPIDIAVSSVVARYSELGRKLTYNDLSRSF